MIKIFLADLVYDTIKTNFAMPLNIGYIAAFAKQKFGNQVDIKLFKYPLELEKALKSEKPDVIGFSHYSWNSRLCDLFIRYSKKLYPNIITVMGGPNVRTGREDLKKFLLKHTDLDYYVVHEGEETFGTLIENLLKQGPQERGFSKPKQVQGIAQIVDGELDFPEVEYNTKPRVMEYASPYLSGVLDSFLKDPMIIPLFETNRGCPFGCTYCAWGVAALSKVRQRPLEQVIEEIDYVANHCVGQVDWIFCDANFGMLQRDIDIAKKIRSVMDVKGFPIVTTLWHSKNTGQRNIEIVKLIGGLNQGYVAIQSTDQEVLDHSGRGTMKLSEFKKVIDHYRALDLPVSTDILIGLPAETAQRHLKSICDAFDLGFTFINVFNIRMLPDTKYETDEFRAKFGVKTKYRPIYGSYGEYGGERVFEIEESIRATNTMSEEELNEFKVLHTMVAIAWNGKIFKPLLQFGQSYGVNPGMVLFELIRTSDPKLNELFSSMKKDSMDEWFETDSEMIGFYQKEENYGNLVQSFMKLYMLYLARIFRDFETVQMIQNELSNIMLSKLRLLDNFDEDLFIELRGMVRKTFCPNPIEPPVKHNIICSGKAAEFLFSNKQFSKYQKVELEVSRSHEIYNFAKAYFPSDLERDKGLTLHALVRFMENGGFKAFVYDLKPIEQLKTQDTLSQSMSS